MPQLSGKSLGFPAMLIVLGGGVFLALTSYMGVLERRAIESPAIREQMLAGRARPLAEVAQTIARLQLVTAEVQTCVTTNVAHDNWRGVASATVEAPVRLLYGVDVSVIKAGSVGYSPAARAYLVRIPPPQRIATEVLGGEETVDVQVGWARLRSRAGEYYLGLARKSLYDRARELVLAPEDARLVRETTIRQVREAVERLVGDAAAVNVVIDDQMEPAPAAAAEGDT